MHLEMIENNVLIIISNLDPAAVKRAIKKLKDEIKPDAQFSSMTINYIADSPVVFSLAAKSLPSLVSPWEW